MIAAAIILNRKNSEKFSWTFGMFPRRFFFAPDDPSSQCKFSSPLWLGLMKRIQNCQMKIPRLSFLEKQDNQVSNVMRNCSKLAVLGSFSIWNARYSSDWNGGAVLKPWRANTHSDSPSNPLSMYFSCIVTTYSSWCSATELGDPPRARCDLWCFPWIQLLHDAVYWKLTLLNELVRSQ